VGMCGDVGAGGVGMGAGVVRMLLFC